MDRGLVFPLPPHCGSASLSPSSKEQLRGSSDGGQAGIPIGTSLPLSHLPISPLFHSLPSSFQTPATHHYGLGVTDPESTSEWGSHPLLFQRFSRFSAVSHSLPPHSAPAARGSPSATSTAPAPPHDPIPSAGHCRGPALPGTGSTSPDQCGARAGGISRARAGPAPRGSRPHSAPPGQHGRARPGCPTAAPSANTAPRGRPPKPVHYLQNSWKAAQSSSKRAFQGTQLQVSEPCVHF